ncbi:hypothetical protein McanMca71_003383 [Microsporum canis]|uniref:Uncharacterized protein n=1 Tax=Arthroderma otae (strain ATCC MYA-4605 / CBS 113480) TaxID=554155 RepID=C5FS96_ARTOC|nr:uncharacterized protein MCYG_05568 [Microsporum canis CBS 113480]EEQ32749.1 predicted protein [Microsporum canis CBS 113480]
MSTTTSLSPSKATTSAKITMSTTTSLSPSKATTSAKITMSSRPTKLPVNSNVSPKPHPKRDAKFLAQLDFDSIQAHFDDMSKEEHDALDKELGHKNFRGPSIPYDDGSDIAYEEELMLSAQDMNTH